MTEHECRQCAFYFKRMERIDPGISVPNEGCIREIEDPDDCHEFQEKWYAGNDNGFRDSMEEEYMSLSDAVELDKHDTEKRLKMLHKMLGDLTEKED